MGDGKGEIEKEGVLLSHFLSTHPTLHSTLPRAAYQIKLKTGDESG